jgi:hypothetical protein
MVVSLKLQVTSLKQVFDMVEVQLYPYNPPPSPEEIERAIAEAKLDESQPPTPDEEAIAKRILGPSLSSDRDEAMLQKLIRVYRRELPELFETYNKPPGGKFQVAKMTPSSISQTLFLTIDQYRELGSPPLFSILTLNVEN